MKKKVNKTPPKKPLIISLAESISLSKTTKAPILNTIMSNTSSSNFTVLLDFREEYIIEVVRSLNLCAVRRLNNKEAIKSIKLCGRGCKVIKYSSHKGFCKALAMYLGEEKTKKLTTYLIGHQPTNQDDKVSGTEKPD